MCAKVIEMVDRIKERNITRNGENSFKVLISILILKHCCLMNRNVLCIFVPKFHIFQFLRCILAFKLECKYEKKSKNRWMLNLYVKLKQSWTKLKLFSCFMKDQITSHSSTKTRSIYLSLFTSFNFIFLFLFLFFKIKPLPRILLILPCRLFHSSSPPVFLQFSNSPDY